MMNNKLRVVTCALVAVLALGVAGCAGGGGAPEKIISGGYIPSNITNIEKGGEFDSSALTPHESNELSLEKLEGFWLYEGIADENNSGTSGNKDSSVVTDKTINLNEGKIECLPKSIDIRPYSPMKALISQGFGYGAAIFQEVADDSNDLGIVGIQMSPSLPYAGNGFICATNGSTLALGFLGPDSELDEYGAVIDKDDKALNECTLTELDYEVSLDGDRLTLSYDGVSATYVQQQNALHQMHKSFWFGQPLYEGNSIISLLGGSPKDLLGKGYAFDCDLDGLLSSRAISEEFSVKTPGGSTLSAKLVNPYEKSVPAGYSKICWYEYDGKKGGSLTVGMPSKYEWSHTSQEFGVTPYSDVYNNYVLPYEASKDSLCYKAGYSSIITGITKWGEGYDTGATVLESERSCDIRLEFEDNVLSSVSIGDAVYLNAGLQDNIAHDALDELKPSVYREVTEQRDEILDELKKSFKAAGLDVVINEKTGEVAMDNSVLFATGSYELEAEGQEYLNKVFKAYTSIVLNDKYSAVLKGISFEGNTDSDGGSEYNTRLSENRANAVMGYCSSLLDDKQKARFDALAVCRGYGESDLVYDENGNENKDASRRVAIKFMLNVEDLKAEPGSQKDSGSSSSASASASSSSSAASDSASSSSATQSESDELKEFRSISSKFDQAWTLHDESESDGSQHIVVLLLSKDHGYCGYFDLKLDASSNPSGYYTFGEASVEETAANTEAITVHHGSDNDKLDVIFNAWGHDDMVSLKDPWKGVNDLTAFEDVSAAITTFEGILG